MKKIIYILLCLVLAISLVSCAGTTIATSDSKEFIKLSDEVIDKVNEFTAEYLKTCEIFPYYDLTNEGLYAENGKTVYDTTEFDPLGIIYELKSTEDENFEGYILVNLKNYQNPESTYVERIEWQSVSPYKFVPEGMYLCYRHNGNYPEWLYTTRPNGGLLNLEDSEEYMAQFDGE